MEAHLVGNNLTPDPSPKGVGSYETSLSVTQWVELARGERAVQVLRKGGCGVKGKGIVKLLKQLRRVWQMWIPDLSAKRRKFIELIRKGKKV